MSLDVVLVVVGALGVVIAALSVRMRQLPVSEPMLGLLAGVLLGPAVTGVLPLPALTEAHEPMHEGTRVLLAVSVMAVALRYPLRDILSRVRPVALLLLLAMPAMALISTGLGMAILGVSFVTALLLGAAVCPTDPVLASSVVTGEPAEHDLPARDREILSLESGANDGLALPLVVIGIAVAGVMTAQEATIEIVRQVLGAVAVGIGAGWTAGWAVRLGRRHGAMAEGPLLLFTVVLALGVLGLSGLLSIDGVLAVFVAGLVFNAVITGDERSAELTIDEAVNRFAVLPLFVLLGAMLPWSEWQALGWPLLGLALAVLFLRRLPVLLLLARPLGLRLPDAVYLGWFGPVGVSALFYLTMEAKELTYVPTEVLAAGSAIVVVSTLAHGLTASPGRALYRRVAAR